MKVCGGMQPVGAPPAVEGLVQNGSVMTGTACCAASVAPGGATGLAAGRPALTNTHDAMAVLHASLMAEAV